MEKRVYSDWVKENPQDSPAEKSDSSPVGKTHFAKLFAVGVLGWLVGMAVLFGLAWPMSGVTTVPSALIWAASHGWAGFLFGFLCLLGFGKIARLPLARAAAAYLLPGLLLGIVAGICLLIYPDRALREDLLTYLSLVFLFYVFGSLWTVMRNEDGEAPAMLRAVISVQRLEILRNCES